MDGTEFFFCGFCFAMLAGRDAVCRSCRLIGAILLAPLREDGHWVSD
jgi:hypothetical protein